MKPEEIEYAKRKRTFDIDRDGVKQLAIEWIAGPNPEITVYIDKVESAHASFQEAKRGISFITPNGATVEVILLKGILSLQFGIYWNEKHIKGDIDPKWWAKYLFIIPLAFGLVLIGLLLAFLISPSHFAISKPHFVPAILASLTLIYLASKICKKSVLALRLFAGLLAAFGIYKLFSYNAPVESDQFEKIMAQIAGVLIYVWPIYIIWVVTQYIEAQQSAETSQNLPE